MDGEEEAETEELTTDEVLRNLGHVHELHVEIKDLKYKHKLGKRAVKVARQESEDYKDSLRRANSEIYAYKNAAVPLEEHNQLQNELGVLKGKHNELVNSSAIRYQTAHQKLEEEKKKTNKLEKEINSLKEQIKTYSPLADNKIDLNKLSRTRTKKCKEIKVEPQEEDVIEESQKVADLERIVNVERSKTRDVTNKLDILQADHNEISTLYDQLRNEMKEKDILNRQLQKKIDTLDDQLKSETSEKKKLIEENSSLQLRISNLLQESGFRADGTLQNENYNLADMPMLISDINEPNDIEVLSDHSSAEVHNQSSDLSESSDAATDDINSIFKEMKCPEKLISPLPSESDVERTQHKTNAQVRKLVTHQTQINKKTLGVSPRKLQIKQKIEKILSSESDAEPTWAETSKARILELVDHQTPMHQKNLEISLVDLNRKLKIKRKKLEMTDKKLCTHSKKLNLVKTKWLSRKMEFLIAKKKLRLTMSELQITQKKLDRMKKLCSYFKAANPKPNPFYCDQGTQCSEMSKAGEVELPTPAESLQPPQTNLDKLEKKEFVQQQKIKKTIKQRLLDDMRRWHTDSFLSYPSAESDMESGLSQSTIRRKKFRKQRHKQAPLNSSDDEDVALSAVNFQKKEPKEAEEKKINPTSDLILKDVTAAARPEQHQEDKMDQDIDSSETIYAKAQGSVDSGYVRTDTGGESEVQNKKRKISQNPEEINKKKRRSSCSVNNNINVKTIENQPEDVGAIETKTQKMVKLFGSDIESISSCPEASAKIPKTAIKTKYLQRVVCETYAHTNESSESDYLRGFAKGCYSSVPKKEAMPLPPLNIVATATTSVNTPNIVQKQRTVTKQTQASRKKQNISTILKDWDSTEDDSTSCTTATETSMRNPLTDDGTQTLTCKVVPKKRLSPCRRSLRKVKPSIKSQLSMTLRSTTKKVDGESSKSVEKTELSTSFKVESESPDYVGKKRIARTPKRNGTEKTTEFDGCVNSNSRKRKVNRKASQKIDASNISHSKQENHEFSQIKILENSASGEGLDSNVDNNETIVENPCTVDKELEEHRTKDDDLEIKGKKRRISVKKCKTKNESRIVGEKSVVHVEKSVVHAKNSEVGTETEGEEPQIIGNEPRMIVKESESPEKPETEGEEPETIGNGPRIIVKESESPEKPETEGEEPETIDNEPRIIVKEYESPEKPETEGEEPETIGNEPRMIVKESESHEKPEIQGVGPKLSCETDLQSKELRTSGNELSVSAEKPEVEGSLGAEGENPGIRSRIDTEKPKTKDDPRTDDEKTAAHAENREVKAKLHRTSTDKLEMKAKEPRTSGNESKTFVKEPEPAEKAEDDGVVPKILCGIQTKLPFVSTEKSKICGGFGAEEENPGTRNGINTGKPKTIDDPKIDDAKSAAHAEKSEIKGRKRRTSTRILEIKGKERRISSNEPKTIVEKSEHAEKPEGEGVVPKINFGTETKQPCVGTEKPKIERFGAIGENPETRTGIYSETPKKDDPEIDDDKPAAHAEKSEIKGRKRRTSTGKLEIKGKERRISGNESKMIIEKPKLAETSKINGRLGTEGKNPGTNANSEKRETITVTYGINGEQSKSNGEKAESKNKNPETIVKKLKLNCDNPANKSLTNEQLVARQKAAQMLKHNVVSIKSTNQASFKRPNIIRRVEIASVEVVNLDPKAILELSTSANSHPSVIALDSTFPPNLHPVVTMLDRPTTPHPTIINSNISSDLNSKVAPVSQNLTPNLIMTDQVPKQPPKAITLKPSVSSNPDREIVASGLLDVVNPESSALSNSDLMDFESPASPEPECDNEEELSDVDPQIIIIPLEPEDSNTKKCKRILNQFLLYNCKSAEMAQEVTNAFLCENPRFIAKLVLGVVSQDIHNKIEIFNYRRAPLLSTVQRAMLGFLMQLEESGVKGVIDNFLTLSEELLLTLKDPKHISPIARVHAAICKMQFDYKTMRLMICKAFFFMGDAAIPYLYIVICSWLELIPFNNGNLSGSGALETRALVQLIRLKKCSQPAYNLHNLLFLLNKYYGYSFDREDDVKLLEDLFKCYISRNRTGVLEDAQSHSIMYLTVALCESLDKNFVFKHLDKLKVRLVVTSSNDETYGIIYLVGIITSQYCKDKEVCTNVSDNKEWLKHFCADSYPENVRNAAKDVLSKF